MLNHIDIRLHEFISKLILDIVVGVLGSFRKVLQTRLSREAFDCRVLPSLFCFEMG